MTKHRHAPTARHHPSIITTFGIDRSRICRSAAFLLSHPPRYSCNFVCRYCAEYRFGVRIPHVHDDLKHVGNRARAFRTATEDEKLTAIAHLERRAAFDSNSWVNPVFTLVPAVAIFGALLVGGQGLLSQSESSYWHLYSMQIESSTTVVRDQAERWSDALSGSRNSFDLGTTLLEVGVALLLVLLAVVALLTTVGTSLNRRRATATAWLAVYRSTAKVSPSKPTSPLTSLKRRFWRH